MIPTARGTMTPVRRALLPFLISISLAACATSGASPGPAAKAHLVVHASGEPVTLEVEIADAPDERALGLMGRSSLPADAGMAFLWAEPVGGSFWMKDTLIPLSIAFWDVHGEIVRILDMEPCAADPCPTYAPGVAFVGAVEVNQGYFAEHGISLGDRVELLPNP